MARIYAEEVERRGAKVQLAFEKKAEGAAKGSPGAAPASNQAAAEASSSSAPDEQEVIVLRGGFTRW